MKRYGVAVLGTGGAAIEHMKAYASNPNVEVVAILSRGEESARGKASALGLSPAIYTDYGKLLSDKRVDLVSICTPNSFHAEQAIQAAEAGKHILVEKPMATTLAETRAMQEAFRRAGVKAMVGFVLHWSPMFRNIRALVDDGIIGEIFMAEAHYWEPAFLGAAWPGWDWWTRGDIAGSSFLCGGCHAVDGVCSLIGQVSEVMAYTTKVNTDFHYDPTVVAILRFRNGAVAKLSSTLESSMPYDFNITLLGTKGGIRNNNQLYSRKLPGQVGFATIPTELPDHSSAPPFPAEINDFVRCIVEDTAPPLDMADSVRTHEVVFAIDRSAAEGRPIKLPLP